MRYFFIVILVSIYCFGYSQNKVNTVDKEAILKEWVEIAKIDSIKESGRDSLMAIGKLMLYHLQSEYYEVSKRIERTCFIPPKTQEEWAKKLREMEVEIRDYESFMTNGLENLNHNIDKLLTQKLRAYQEENNIALIVPASYLLYHEPETKIQFDLSDRDRQTLRFYGERYKYQIEKLITQANERLANYQSADYWK